VPLVYTLPLGLIFGNEVKFTEKNRLGGQLPGSFADGTSKNRDGNPNVLRDEVAGHGDVTGFTILINRRTYLR